jgi:polyphosphate kinase
VWEKAYRPGESFFRSPMGACFLSPEFKIFDPEVILMAQDCFENRELSWLRFNERVLEEAEDARVPLCERLSFLSIFQTNLDEFFMVRIGSLHDEMLLNRDSRDNKTNQTPRQQLTAALGRIAELSQRRDLAYYSLLGALSEQGISMVNFRQISRQSEKALSDLFDHDFQPLLSAFMVSRKQTFPFLQNKQIYAVALLEQSANRESLRGVFRLVPCRGVGGDRLLALFRPASVTVDGTEERDLLCAVSPEAYGDGFEGIIPC